MIPSLVVPRLENVKLDGCDSHIHLAFDKPVEFLSSAVLNGGFVFADHYVNLNVEKNFSSTHKSFPSPKDTIGEYILNNNWAGNSVGMMTSASMRSFRSSYRETDGIIVECYLTAGISNARRAGDHAEWQSFDENPTGTGTINIVVGTNAKLSHAAMVEAIMIITEAKTSVLEYMNILSPVSNKVATGTGTDSTAIFCGDGREINFCGKHVLFGEMIASVVIEALKSSIGFRYIV